MNPHCTVSFYVLWKPNQHLFLQGFPTQCAQWKDEPEGLPGREMWGCDRVDTSGHTTHVSSDLLNQNHISFPQRGLFSSISLGFVCLFVWVLIKKPFPSPESDTRKIKTIKLFTHAQLTFENDSGVIASQIDQNYTAGKFRWIKREERQNGYVYKVFWLRTIFFPLMRMGKLSKIHDPLMYMVFTVFLVNCT